MLSSQGLRAVQTLANGGLYDVPAASSACPPRLSSTAMTGSPREKVHNRKRLLHLRSWRKLALLAIAAAFTAPGFAAEDITGVWLTAENEGAIEIRPCGSDRCGFIVWMGDPKSEGKTDQHN